MLTYCLKLKRKQTENSETKICKNKKFCVKRIKMNEIVNKF